MRGGGGGTPQTPSKQYKERSAANFREEDPVHRSQFLFALHSAIFPAQHTKCGCAFGSLV